MSDLSSFLGHFWSYVCYPWKGQKIKYLFSLTEENVSGANAKLIAIILHIYSLFIYLFIFEMLQIDLVLSLNIDFAI